MKTVTIVAGAAFLGGLYWLYRHHEAQGQIYELPPLENPPVTTMPGGQGQVVTAPLPPPFAASLPSPDPVQLQALLSWTSGTGNPQLYASWINQLDPTDLNNMYDILVNDWMSGAGASPTQTSNWNDLVKRYPFLKIPQSMVGGCMNFNCS